MSDAAGNITVTVTFMLKDDAALTALREKARQVDDETTGEHAVSYTEKQALAVVWHNEPEWLHEHALRGWVVEDDLHWSDVEMVEAEDAPSQDKEN